MPGLFSALELSKRALLAQQLAMNTAGQNIANSTTPGYSRQRVTLTSTQPLDTPQGSVGTGVTVSSITQVRDLFLAAQYRGENSNLSSWDATQKTLSQIESIFNEPGDQGLNQLITNFWNSWDNLATNPSARSTVVEQAKTLINAFHQHAQQLIDLHTSVNNQINDKINQINQLGSQIASLNKQIVSSEIGGDTANDLRDKRDLLVDQLSSIAQVTTNERPNGSIQVLLGSMGLVDGGNALRIVGQTENTKNGAVTTPVWENTSFKLQFTGGEIFSLQQQRDKTIPEYLSNLDQLASTIVKQVNQVHSSGIAANGATNVNFFDPTNLTAISMSLNTQIESDSNFVAASISGEPGDIRNAQAISDLRSHYVMQSNSVTINEYFSGMVGTLGTRTQEANNLKENYSLLVNQLENAKQSVQGVSVDEEVTNMIKFQRAYEAAARMVTYIDSSLETIISGMGVTR